MLAALDELEALLDVVALLEVRDETEILELLDELEDVLGALLNETELTTLFLSILSSMICA